MASNGQTSKEYFTILTVIHSALLTGQTAFAAVAYYLVSSGQFVTNGELKSVFQIVASVLVLGGILAGYLLGKNQLQVIRSKSKLLEKLVAYRSMMIIKWALLEMPSLFAIVSFLLTGSSFFLGLMAVILVIFFMNRPSAYSVAADLELSPHEKQILETPTSIITD